jgi:hypothetical protein
MAGREGIIQSQVIRSRRGQVPALVALYRTGAPWFTSSTSFANPTITVTRSLTNSFAGVAPRDAARILAALNTLAS